MCALLPGLYIGGDHEGAGGGGGGGAVGDLAKEGKKCVFKCICNNKAYNHICLPLAVTFFPHIIFKSS